MADEVLSDKDNRVYCGGPDDPEDHPAEEAIYPGMAVTMSGNTDGSVRPANGGVADENIYGVAGVPEGCDPDTVIAIGNPVPVHKKGSGAVVWMHLAGAAGPIPVEAGDIAVISTTDGYVAKGDESSVAVKAGFKVGVFQHYDAGHATDKHMVRVKI